MAKSRSVQLKESKLISELTSYPIMTAAMQATIANPYTFQLLISLGDPSL
jgi:hypothetical protein